MLVARSWPYLEYVSMYTMETDRIYKPGIIVTFFFPLLPPFSFLSHPFPFLSLLFPSLFSSFPSFPFPSLALFPLEPAYQHSTDIIHITLKGRWHTHLKINIQLDEFYLCMYHYPGQDIQCCSKMFPHAPFCQSLLFIITLTSVIISEFYFFPV